MGVLPEWLMSEGESSLSEGMEYNCLSQEHQALHQDLLKGSFLGLRHFLQGYPDHYSAEYLRETPFISQHSLSLPLSLITGPFFMFLSLLLTFIEV